jgi:hypothetical protein
MHRTKLYIYNTYYSIYILYCKYCKYYIYACIQTYMCLYRHMHINI